MDLQNTLCERKREESEQLNKDISRLETVISRFKSNNEEYLKIKNTVEEEISRFLKDGKVLLQFALASIIESIRRNPDKYNDHLVGNASLSSTMAANQSLLSNIEDYKDMILDEAKRLYDRLVKHFINSIMHNAADKSSSSDPKLSSTFARPSNLGDTYRRIEEQGSFHDSEHDIAD